ncbi:MAG: hypothetical protein KDK89_04275 [Alphaproteobacteria bacterium]|nr:hypothetical protein [Alphaproteobacteria bacterium]
MIGKAALATLALLAMNTAALALTEFKGEFKVTAQNQTCTDISGDLTVLTWKMRLMLPNLGGNDARTSLTIIQDGVGAANYTLASGSLIGLTFQSVSFANVYRYAGRGTAKVRFTSQRPSVPTNATTDIRIKGNIRNFDGDSGCNVTFSATGFKP